MEDKVLFSRQKWITLGFLLVLLAPLPAGLIYGLALWREHELKAEGKWMVIFSLLWGAVLLAMVRRFI